MPKFSTSVLVAACAGSLLFAPATQAKQRPSGDEQLATLLQGRVAGKPSQCISTFASNNLQVIDKTAIVYDQGKTVWVNRTSNPARLDDNDILVITRLSGSDLCRLDNVRAVDRNSGMLRSFVFLENFIPYRKGEAVN